MSNYILMDNKEIKVNGIVDVLEEIEKKREKQIKEQINYIDNRLLTIEKSGGQVIKLVANQEGNELKVIYKDKDDKQQEQILLKK